MVLLNINQEILNIQNKVLSKAILSNSKLEPTNTNFFFGLF